MHPSVTHPITSQTECLPLFALPAECVFVPLTIGVWNPKIRFDPDWDESKGAH
jgi:hypothetical protein